ncbi:arylsulfatase [Ulvibacterium sp.]|uniref:arylsulfatase n=1 Tax=Ulvibacterium sp. TaxID=2665914 RepID=UPI003BA9776A
MVYIYKKYMLFALIVLVVLAACSEKTKPSESKPKETKAPKPNIIFILADDLGYGDLGCYGQQKIKTPHIDQLALNGMRFTQHYSGSTVCAPSRSALMSGQHTGHTYIRGNRELKGQEGQTPIPDSLVILPEALKTVGYTTGAFGKWGLGFVGSEGDPINQGFDTFYGYNCQRMAHRYYPTHLWDNQEIDSLPGNDWIQKVTYAPDVIQKRMLRFIEENKEVPFFAYVPLILPHAELISPQDSILAKYAGKFEEPHPYKGGKSSGYGPNLKISDYTPQEIPRATFASMVARTDAYVGQIVAKVFELGIAGNTIIVFTSDNGPHVEAGADPEFFNSTGGLRGVKRDLYEGGVRVPMIVSWPGKIQKGSISQHISAFWDFFPTIADITGTAVPEDIDGISFLPALLGDQNQEQHEYLYWEFINRGGRQAVRMGDWKGVKYKVRTDKDAPMELYNLAIDPSETTNVASKHPEVVAQIEQLLSEARVESELFPLFKESTP